jgi:hypothetical protein
MNCLQQRFAIQWYLARPCIISGQDARTTRNFGIFFKLEVSYRKWSMDFFANFVKKCKHEEQSSKQQKSPLVGLVREYETPVSKV